MTFLLMSFVSFFSFPETEISNGMMHLRVYLPDPETGYYRGTRFDWSGLIPGIEYDGHTFSGQWFEKYDPIRHDAVMGPVEAFSPLGYKEAGTGGKFVKIGVGTLIKKDSGSYSPYRYYEISNPGIWKVKIKSGQVVFSHTLIDSTYSYEYKKTIQLKAGKPVMEIDHQLKNTGKNLIETEVYDHNFFLIDNQKISAQCFIRFPFNVTEKKEGQGLGELASIRGKEIVINRSFLKTEQAYTRLEGFQPVAKDYDIQIENLHTGAGVRISADQPMSKLIFWACSTIFCPEPYIQLKINPGETVKWKISYKFYTCHIQP